MHYSHSNDGSFMSLMTAATRPTNLLLVAIAFGAGLTIALWLLPVGLIAYAARVALTWRDPQLGAQMQARARVIRPPRGTPFQPQLEAIARAQSQIAQSVAAADGPLRTALDRVVTQVESIVQEAYALAHKGQAIVTYLQHTNLADLNNQLAQLDREIRTATDSMLRQQYAETRTAIMQRIEHAQALATYQARIAAQLNNIRANLDTILAETVRLRAAPAVDTGFTADTVSERIADMRADMDALGRMLDSALTGVS
jgi:chaperonin cofactor prefoldin